jgi:hypothetical protein
MPTLQAILEEVASLGPGYLISDHGAYWLVSDLLERLDREAPKKLAYSVSWVVPDDAGDGAIYACEDAYDVTSIAPLYRTHRLSSTFPSLDSSGPEEQHP